MNFVGAAEAGGTADETEGKDGDEGDAGGVCAANSGTDVDEGGGTGGPAMGERGKAVGDPLPAPPPSSRHPHKPLESA